VFRGDDGDVIGLVGEDLPGTPLLEPVLRGGAPVAETPPVAAVRDRAAVQRAALTVADARADTSDSPPAAALPAADRPQGAPLMTDSKTTDLLRGQDELAGLLERKAEQLRDVFAAAGRTRAVIGLSGGIDSAVSLGLAARALGPRT
jgi:hypothetical protein